MLEYVISRVKMPSFPSLIALNILFSRFGEQITTDLEDEAAMGKILDGEGRRYNELIRTAAD